MVNPHDTTKEPTFAHGLALKPIQLGPHRLENPVFVAPMAGVTDRPFRQLCKRLGAGYAVSEMAASNPKLWASVKTSRRLNHDGEIEPKAVQIAGADPTMMAQAARFNVERGAQIIDINMGCPAKKVCNVLSGSALMSDEKLALEIIKAVVNSVEVPVTLKMRTGPSPSLKNALNIALNAQDAGIKMIIIHGRTRADQYMGKAEYDTIALVKSKLQIPVVANGDIDSPQKALEVLRYTGADAVMVGRAAQGNPWILGQINHFLRTGILQSLPNLQARGEVLMQHLTDHYSFYGETTGVRTARKHVAWYLGSFSEGNSANEVFLAHFFTLQRALEQLAALHQFFAFDNFSPEVYEGRTGEKSPQLLAA